MYDWKTVIFPQSNHLHVHLVLYMIEQHFDQFNILYIEKNDIMYPHM